MPMSNQTVVHTILLKKQSQSFETGSNAFLFTSRVSDGGNRIGPVCLSVCLCGFVEGPCAFVGCVVSTNHENMKWPNFYGWNRMWKKASWAKGLCITECRWCANAAACSIPQKNAWKGADWIKLQCTCTLRHLTTFLLECMTTIHRFVKHVLSIR